MNRMMRNILSLVIMALWLLPAVSQAAKVTEVPKDFDKFQMQGAVDYISPGNDFIELNEFRVYLADVIIEGKRRTTNVTNLDGKDVDFNQIRKGGWVFVRGAMRPDKSIVARDIVILPRRIPERERAKYPVLEDLKDWRVTGK